MDILNMTVLDMQKAMENGTLSSVEIVQFYLNRISSIDQGDIKYNSVFEVNPDALYIAQSLDFERQNGTVRSAIHGIPVLLKDNINTGDKTRTTAGARFLQTHYAIEDAFITKTLREKGAVILGKTNLTELACFKSFQTVNGYSSLSGYVLCPWDIKEDPSGSSTGSAVSVSLRVTPLAIGTETGGSIMSPSMKNGVVGLKPTIGFVSRRGIIPISSTLDTAGPMANTVSDVATLLTAIRGNDPDDPVTLTKPDMFIDYTTFLQGTDLDGVRIGIDTTHLDKLSDTRQAIFTQVCDTFKSLGAELVDNLGIEQTKMIYQVMKYEFKANIDSYLADEGIPYTLEDIVRYNEEHANENLKYGQEVLYDVLNNTSGRMIEQEYMDALNERFTAITKLNTIFNKQKLDMIYFANYTSLGPHCGYPTMSIPVGLDEKGLPIGTYFLAPHFKEDTLIRIGHALEQTINVTLNPLKKD